MTRAAVSHACGWVGRMMSSDECKSARKFLKWSRVRLRQESNTSRNPCGGERGVRLRGRSEDSGAEARLVTGKQCREARKLLGWSQERLASHSGVYQGLISTFEISGVMSRDTSLAVDRVAVLRSMFEAAGVEFTNGGEAGVNLRNAKL